MGVVRKRQGRSRIAGGLVALGAALLLAPGAQAAPWVDGDVFTGVSNGTYKVYTPAGVQKDQVNDPASNGYTTGCAFNEAGDLYGTGFSTSSVPRWSGADPHVLLQTIPSNSFGPESIVFDADGDFYVGSIGGGIRRHDGTTGAVTATLAAARRIDFMDLAVNQTTMFTTDEGRVIHRHDMATDLALPDFATLPGSGNAFALRLLGPGDGTGGLLVADGLNVKRLDAAGNVVQVYDVPGEDSWFSLNLDPDGTSFWAGNFDTANFYRIDIATGAIVTGPINTATGPNTLFGICVLGEITAARNFQLTLTPPDATNDIGDEHTVTAKLVDQDGPVSGGSILFTVTGANATSGSATTDANGNAEFSWTGTNPGEDTVTACFDEDADLMCDEGEKRAVARKTWVQTFGITLTPADAVNEVGTDHTVTATVGDQRGPVTGEEVLFTVSGANPMPGAGTTTDPDGEATFTWTGNNAGVDTVTACHDADRDGECDDGEATAEAKKRWVVLTRDGAFGCRAATLRALTIELFVANPPYAPCRDDLSRLAGGRALSLGAIGVRLDVAESSTDANLPGGTKPLPGDSATARSELARLRIALGTTTIEARAVRSSVAATCGADASTPTLTTDGEVVGLLINGNPVADTSAQRSIPLGIGTLHLNWRSTSNGVATRRGIFLQTILGNVVVAESVAGSTGRACTTPPLPK